MIESDKICLFHRPTKTFISNKSTDRELKFTENYIDAMVMSNKPDWDLSKFLRNYPFCGLKAKEFEFKEAPDIMGNWVLGITPPTFRGMDKPSDRMIIILYKPVNQLKIKHSLPLRTLGYYSEYDNAYFKSNGSRLDKPLAWMDIESTPTIEQIEEYRDFVSNLSK